MTEQHVFTGHIEYLPEPTAISFLELRYEQMVHDLKWMVTDEDKAMLERVLDAFELELFREDVELVMHPDDHAVTLSETEQHLQQQRYDAEEGKA